MLVIPHILVLYVYGIALFFVLIFAWFAALFTGHLPDSLEWRATAYMYGLSTVYPSFGLPSGDADPGGDTAVIMFRRDQRLSRVRCSSGTSWSCLICLSSTSSTSPPAVSLIAWFAVLFTGRWPTGMREFFVGYHRWYLRYMPSISW